LVITREMEQGLVMMALVAGAILLRVAIGDEDDGDKRTRRMLLFVGTHELT